MELLKKLWNHFSKQRKRQFILIQILIVFASFLEMASLGAVIPFLTVLSDPSIVYDQENFKPVINLFGFQDPAEIVIPITLVFIFLIFFSAIIRLTLLWALVKLSQLAGADLSIDIYKHTLFQDYSIHVSRNSSEVINGIITKTTTVTKGVIAPVLNLISSSVTIIGIIAVLLLVDISVTFIGFLGFGGSYLLVIYLTRRNLKENSKNIAEKSDLMVKSLQEGLEGIREVLINNNQKFYTKLYQESDLEMRKAAWRNELIYSSPRFGMEAIGIGIVALFALSATLSSGGIDRFLPVLGAFVLGAQKLLPAIQKAYASYSRIRGGQYSLHDVIALLDQPVPDYVNLPLPNPNQFNNSIELRNISFRYNVNTPYVIKDLNLRISRGSVVGIVGSTGCGKSTLLDILMGLLAPSNGELLVDNQIINNTNKRSWQRHISNVPQHIYLSDGTIEENIAFGIPSEEIDCGRVIAAANKAQISNFIDKLDHGYKTLVGERGMRLSGGQRQRIGLARAFYKQSDVLILDEATSALDDKTESAVMKSIEGIDKDTTVLIIAHRLTTLKRCDKIIKFENNFLYKTITYNELINERS